MDPISGAKLLEFLNFEIGDMEDLVSLDGTMMITNKDIPDNEELSVDSFEEMSLKSWMSGYLEQVETTDDEDDEKEANEDIDDEENKETEDHAETNTDSDESTIAQQDEEEQKAETPRRYNLRKLPGRKL